MRLHSLPGSFHVLYAKALVPSLTPRPHFPAGIVATIPDQVVKNRYKITIALNRMCSLDSRVQTSVVRLSIFNNYIVIL